MDDLTIRGRALYVDSAEVLVVADPHVGRDESSNVQFPLGERADLRTRLTDHLECFNPETVVFAGDVIHTHGTATTESATAVREIASVCHEGGAEPVFVAGNHDGALSDVWGGDVHGEYVIENRSVEERSIEDDQGGSSDAGSQTRPTDAGSQTRPTDAGSRTRSSDVTTPGRTVVCHGHEPPATQADRYVIGHDHPMIVIEGVRYPCVLVGSNVYRSADVVMLPAFSQLPPGVVVNGMRSAEFQSPLVTDIDAFQPLVYDENSAELLEFPPLGEFRELL